MTRTTNSDVLVCLAVLNGLLLGLAGCGQDYDHQPLDENSPLFRETAGLIDAACQADSDDALGAHLAAHKADSLNDAQTQALRATLQSIAQAERAELKSVDSFGPQIYRAIIELTNPDAPAPQTLAVLLVRPDEGGPLFWAGAN